MSDPYHLNSQKNQLVSHQPWWFRMTWFAVDFGSTRFWRKKTNWQSFRFPWITSCVLIFPNWCRISSFNWMRQFILIVRIPRTPPSSFDLERLWSMTAGESQQLRVWLTTQFINVRRIHPSQLQIQWRYDKIGCVCMIYVEPKDWRSAVSSVLVDLSWVVSAVLYGFISVWFSLLFSGNHSSRHVAVSPC